MVWSLVLVFIRSLLVVGCVDMQGVSVSYYINTATATIVRYLELCRHLIFLYISGACLYIEYCTLFRSLDAVALWPKQTWLICIHCIISFWITIFSLQILLGFLSGSNFTACGRGGLFFPWHLPNGPSFSLSCTSIILPLVLLVTGQP